MALDSEPTVGAPRALGAWSIIDDPTAFNATTNSHNRKIVEAGPYVFVGYRDGESLCRVAKSRDAGDTWEQVDLPRLAGVQAPVLAADRDGCVHLMYRLENSTMRYLRFSPDDDWSAPEVNQQSVQAGAKYTLEYDAVHDLLYFSHRVEGNLCIAVLDKDGKVVRDVRIVDTDRQGKVPDYKDPHYQSMFADTEGWLHVIYTCTDFHLNAQPPHPRYRYQSVRYLRTRDQGLCWERAGGTELDVPYEIGKDAPDTRVNTEAEEKASPVWGASLAVTNGQVHVLYSLMEQPSRAMYARLDRKTGQVAARAELPLDGTANALAVDPNARVNSPAPVCAFGILQHRPALAVTLDNGDSWRLAGHLPEVPIRPGYQIHWTTSMSCLSREGYVYSAFTERVPGVPENKLDGGRTFFARWRLA